MNKYFLPGIVLATVAIIIGGVLLTSRQNNEPPPPLPTSYEYFWGDGCPHCAKVQEFFDSWEGRDKVSIDKKEVWGNRSNASLMQERAKYCKVNPSGMGVPFLFTPEGKCISGDQPIIDFFKSLDIGS